MLTRKILFGLFFFISFCLTSFAQQDRWSIGPRGGINFSNVNHLDESESVTGVALGLTTTYSLNENSGLTLDVLYSSEGYQAPFEEYHLRYLQMPFYYNYFLGELGDRLRPKIYVGIAPAIWLGGTLNELDVNDQFFNKFLISGTGGLGFNYRVGNRIWLNTDLRSFIGLSDIRARNFIEGESINPRTVQVSLGLAYGFSRID